MTDWFTDVASQPDVALIFADFLDEQGLTEDACLYREPFFIAVSGIAQTLKARWDGSYGGYGGDGGDGGYGD